MNLWSALLAYSVPAALITMLPGPDTVMVLATASKAGQRAAVRAACGVGTGLLLWGAVAAVGLATALRSTALIYAVFRLSCAAYLVFLGVQALLAWRRTTPTTLPSAAPSVARRNKLPTLGWGFRKALLTCLLNPKLGVFFVVFLPQFIPQGAPVGSYSMALAGLQAVEAVLWYLVVGHLAGAAGRLLARRRVRQWLDGLTGVVFLGFGVRLAAEVRR